MAFDEPAADRIAAMERASSCTPLLRLSDLSVMTRDSQRPVVKDVCLTICQRDSIGIVGESGSGKSMTWLAVFGLLPRNTWAVGNVSVHGRNIVGASDREMSALRGNVLAMVPQEPMSSLNPVRSVGSQIVEVLKRKKGVDTNSARREAVRLLDRVRIGRAAEQLRAFPHELSGGMCQRVLIAIALAGEPDLLVADEPTTALDVTIQAEILDLIRELQSERDMALVMISHDLGVVAQSCRELLVMYAGSVVEKGTLRELIEAPLHPYSRELVMAARWRGERSGIRVQQETIARGTPAIGCAFAARCPSAVDRCHSEHPRLLDHRTGRQVACHCVQ